MSSRILPSRRFVLAGGVGAGLAAAAPGWAAGETAAAAEGKRIKVAFIGDSMADGLWGSFVRSFTRDKCLKDHADGGRYAKNGTGLTRTEFDWPAQARKIVETYAPTAVVASVGLNDRQDVVAGGTRATYGTPAFEAAYRDRIKLLLEAGASAGAGVLLVGLPAMRDAVTQTDAQSKNKLFAEAAAAIGKPAIQYIEPWHPANAAPGVYTSAAPGTTGGLVQVRAPDGIHFTQIGYDVVWAYLYPKLVANLKNTGRDLGAECPGT